MILLAAKDIKVTRGNSMLLDVGSLDFDSHGAVAVIGPNGSGKSTLLKVLAGIERPDSGEVRLEGRALATYAGFARAKIVGYLPQQFEPHWDLSVIDLIRLGAERAGDATDTVPEQAIAQFELASVRQRRWSTLSGGERARVLLATILAIDPPLLLADEPAASLDIKHRIHVSAALARRGKDRLSIVVMHDLELAFQLFERIVLMDKGRIVADGPADEIVHDNKLDDVFGVRFKRIEGPGHVSLQIAAIE